MKFSIKAYLIGTKNCSGYIWNKMKSNDIQTFVKSEYANGD